MKSPLNAAGTVSVAPGEVRINLSADFCKYYRSLLLEALKLDPLEFQIPKHGAHITIVSRKIHPGIDTSELRLMNGMTVNFTYDPDILEGGARFKTYYVKVTCAFAEKLKEELGIFEGDRFLGFHICICNNKSLVKSNNSNSRVL